VRVDDGEGMWGKEDCAVAVGFKVDSAIVPLSLVMEVLDSRRRTRNWDPLPVNSLHCKRGNTKTLDRYEVEFPFA